MLQVHHNSNMKRSQRSAGASVAKSASLLATLGLISVLMTLSGCEATAPAAPASNDEAARMSLDEAKQIIQRGRMWIFSDGIADPQIPVEFGLDHMTAFRYWHDGRHDRSDGCPYESFRPYVSPTPLKVGIGVHKGATMYLAHAGCKPDTMSLTVSVPTREQAQKVAAAMLRFKSSTQAERRAWQEQKQRQFAEVAERYRTANPKPAVDENLRRARIMALSAVREKQLSFAAETYEDALKGAPWWPEGHFNVAIILGELRYYNEAVDHMKKYLALAPEAQNARAAQDKIYEWEGQEREAGY